MIQNFSVTQLHVDEKNGKLILCFSLDIDEDTIDNASVVVVEDGDKKKPIVNTERSIDGKNLIVDMPEIKVNTKYEVVVTTDVRSITRMPLATKFRRRFWIDSAVDSTVQILSPSDFEEVDSMLTILLKEVPGKSGTRFESYEVQIASESGFYDVLHSMVVAESSSVSMKALKEAAQYFIRARVVDGNGNFGNWSDKRTFTFSNSKASFNADDDDPVFIDSMNIIAMPDAGKTPDSFIFVFDHELDPASIDSEKILLLRKQV